MQDPTMTTKLRPWYCNESLTDDYAALLSNGGDFQMLKALKILRSIIVNLGIIGISIYALMSSGVDVTMVAIVSIITLGLYNGIEVADYAALAQAFQESKNDK